MTIARYGLFIEAALRPEFQERLAESAQAIREWGTRWLRAIGSTDPEGECAAILNYVDGVILHQLTFPDPSDELEATVQINVQRLCTTGP